MPHQLLVTAKLEKQEGAGVPSQHSVAVALCRAGIIELLLQSQSKQSTGQELDLHRMPHQLLVTAKLEKQEGAGVPSQHSVAVALCRAGTAPVIPCMAFLYSLCKS